jgi:hypothetical protein
MAVPQAFFAGGFALGLEVSLDRLLTSIEVIISRGLLLREEIDERLQQAA